MQQHDIKISYLGFAIWFIAAFFFLYEFFLRTFVGTISTQLISDLNLTLMQFTWIGSAYYIAYGFMQMPVGLLADKFGVKAIMIFATLSCALASFLFSESSGFLTAVSSRFLMGFGSSFAFVCLLVIVSNWFPLRYFALFAGLSQFIGTMGPAMAGGPLVSWIEKAHITWRVAMSSIGAIGIALAILTLLFVKTKPKGQDNRFIFAKKTIGIKAGLKSLIKIPQVWLITFYSMCVYVPIAILAAVWGTGYLESLGLPQSEAAYMISISWFAYACTCPIFGFLSDMMRRRKLFLLISAIAGLLGTSGILFMHLTQSWEYEFFFLCIGIGAAGQNIGFASIAENVTSDVKASAIGLNNAGMTVASAILPFLVGYLIRITNHGDTSNILQIKHSAFMIGLGVLPALYLLGVLCLLFFKETYCKPQRSIIYLSK